ncbi:MAG: hypothetical protein OXB88_05810 [Bacteriovoracales bacterium]|nr:hypothetical protein [Bacteriovoracales bacterium]
MTRLPFLVVLASLALTGCSTGTLDSKDRSSMDNRHIPQAFWTEEGQGMEGEKKTESQARALNRRCPSGTEFSKSPGYLESITPVNALLKIFTLGFYAPETDGESSCL